ncbi:MAG TPA: M56 family metallopeptidase [Blastocatellia bacterium]
MMSTITEVTLFVSRWFELSLVVKATALLVLGLLMVVLTRRSRASVRHLILATTFAGIGLLPLILIAEPVIPIRVVSTQSSAPDSSGSPAPTATALPAPTATELPRADVSRGLMHLVGSHPAAGQLLRRTAYLIWIVGVLVFLAPLAISAWRVRRYRCGALPWPEQQEGIRVLAAELGIHIPVEVLLHEKIAAPLTCGFLNAAILLPVDAPDRGDAGLRRSLVHELEHIRRRDWLTQALARTICGLYWFHPLVWMAWRRLCLEAERACDDAAIQHEQPVERAEYAAQLVSLARRMSAEAPAAVLCLANRSDLSKRVSALLDGTQRRGRAGLAAIATILIGAALFTFALAPLHVVAQTGSARESEPGESQLTRELPLYPGANLKPEDRVEKPHRASLDLQHLEVSEASAAKYQAAAAAPDVLAYYRRSLQRFGSVTECTGGQNRLVSIRVDPQYLQNPGACRPMQFGEGETELKTVADGEHWIVTVLPTAAGSEFTLVHVRNAKPARASTTH